MGTAVYMDAAKSFQYINPVLIALFQVSNKESPFKTHPIQTWVFVVATIIYSLAFQLSYAAVAVISGSLSTVLLVSLFLPNPIRSIFNAIHGACPRLNRQMIMDFISKFSVVWTWLTRSSSSEQEQEQPQPLSP